MSSQPTAAIEEIRRRSAERLKTPLERILFMGIESQFPWIRQGEIIWARNYEYQSAVFWAPPNESPLLLTGPDGLEPLSRLITGQAGPLPLCLPPEQLASAVRQLNVDPRGFVGSPEFLKRQTPLLSQWLQKDTLAGREKFQGFCESPKLEDNGKEWVLKFTYFNPAGGVEQWEAAGDRAQVRSTKSSVAAPDKTFRWPYRN